ncbi:Cof-type HAD-IIB family hydrolase [Dolosicoccus paucivorans]
MEQSLVFFDLDGTLLNSQSKISPEVKESLGQLRLNGHVPIVASGRPYSQISNLLKEAAFDSYILVNGQSITYKSENIYHSKFPLDEINHLIEETTMRDIPLGFYGHNNHIINRATNLVHATFDHFGITDRVVDADFYKNNDILMMLLFTENLEDDDYFAEVFPNFNFYRTSPYSIDVIQSGNSKFEAIKYLIDNVDVTFNNIYAFGDGMNDIEMIDFVNHGIAMGNAIEEVKEVADLIVASNDDGGIIEGLEYFGLI